MRTAAPRSIELKPVIKGLATMVPGLHRLLAGPGGGGTDSADYCYGEASTAFSKRAVSSSLASSGIEVIARCWERYLNAVIAEAREAGRFPGRGPRERGA